MDKKLKIGFDAKRLFMNNTGLGNYSRNLVRNLKQFYPEHEYHLFSPKIVENNSTKYFLENDFIIHTCPSWQPAWYWRSFGVANKINELGLDIFHGLSHEIPYGISKKTKTIVTIHDLIYEKYPELFGWWNSKIYQWKYRSSCKRSDVIFAISKSTAQDISELYHINADKIKITYQSCDQRFQTIPMGEQPKSYFLYVGTINKRKSLKDIVTALSQLPEDKKKNLVVVGDGGYYKHEVLEEIKKYNLQDWIIFKGNLNNDELIKLYDNALCLILPSQYEGFGIPIIESLFRKTPVITCNNSSLPEAAGAGAILIDHGNVKSLLNAMIAIQDVKVWNVLSESGNSYVNEIFNTYKTSLELHTNYLDCL